MTASADEANSTWPFVTLHEFHRRSASARSLSGSYFTSILPIITTDDIRKDWETYSMAQKGWLTEGRQYQAEKGLGDLERSSALLVPPEPFIFPSIIKIDENFTVNVDEGVRKTTHFYHGIEPSHSPISSHPVSQTAWTILSCLADVTNIASTK